MKKNTFIENPINGFRRLSFPKRGLKVFAITPQNGLSFELATEENEFVVSIDGGIGITDTVDGLRAFQAGDDVLQVLTFDPALFSFRFEKNTVTFSKDIASGKPKTVYELPLDANSYFVIAERRRWIEVWMPASSEPGC